MDEKKLRKLLEEKLGNLSEKELQKIEKYLTEEKNLRRQKIEKIKELIERGEYNVPPEKVAEKLLEYLKKNR
ncbi:flagellar biosynthesis anti-sigma factor FlgM [Persephonella sp. KM09-Lau-8]|uniref:flagellar biosynthesis anti-sigma factor FlgM n=1 Tax=Persephonella sp. KM09-Lau-8 TaxID=1158345 RepID=UPI00055E6966|nr:flagellar biosynthesis anti-sigma factor FlgM [Persephonella sp. KM09-Lau-8]